MEVYLIGRRVATDLGRKGVRGMACSLVIIGDNISDDITSKQDPQEDFGFEDACEEQFFLRFLVKHSSGCRTYKVIYECRAREPQ